MTKGRPVEKRSDIADRFAAILGEAKLAEKIGVLFGVGRRTYYKWEQALEYPAYAVNMLELLERLPRDQWPARLRNEIAQVDRSTI